MPKHRRLALSWVFATAVVSAVLVTAVPSSGANYARDASPRGGTILKRQGQGRDKDSDGPIPSVVASLISNFPEVPPSSSFGFGIIPTTTTTITSSLTLDTTSTSTSTSSTTSTRFDPAPTTSTSKSTTTTARGVPTTTTLTTSRAPLASSTSTTTTPPPVQTTTSANTNPIVNSRTGVTLATTVSFAPTYTASVTQSTSIGDNQITSEDSNASQSSDKGFMGNKGAVGATFTVVGLVGAGLLICAVLFIRKRIQDRNLNKADWDDVNDAASMAEFASASAHIGGGTGTTVVLPSAALARQPSSRGNGGDPHEMDQDHPDSVLAMPPVMNYEHPRASAYDIVPAAPPQLRIPGNHNSFGSMMGADPFAGAPTTPWQDAERDAVYDPGQAGRGAGVNALSGGRSNGYNMQPYSGGVGVAVGSDENAFGSAAYGGGHHAPGYQYGYPSHAYGQQYTSNPQQGGYGYGY